MNGLKLEHVERFLGHGIPVFILTLVLSIVLVVVSQTTWQVVGILSLGVGWLVGGAAYSLYKSKASFYENLPGSMKYDRVTKQIRIINEKGDAFIKFIYEGENLSDNSLEDLFHTLPDYDSDQFPPKVIQGYINGLRTDVNVQSSSKMQQDSKGAKKFESRFLFQFSDPVEPKSKMPVHDFEVLITKCYPQAFSDWASTMHSVDVQTDELIIRLITEDAITISNWEPTVKDFHKHMDTKEIERIKRECPPRQLHRSMLVWKIHKPKLTDRYILRFKLAP